MQLVTADTYRNGGNFGLPLLWEKPAAQVLTAPRLMSNASVQVSKQGGLWFESKGV